MSELKFGGAAETILVDDCDPGQELQTDTGWMNYWSQAPTIAHERGWKLRARGV